MNRIDLDDRTAIVTGAAQGIGLAVAKRLSASGARVAGWDIDSARLGKAFTAISGSRAEIACDISSPDSVNKAIKATRKALGPVDILVNSAGIAGPNATVDRYPFDDWKRILDVNLTGTFLTNAAVIPDMVTLGHGRIVNIASVAGKEGNPNACAYSASKAGVIAFTKSLAKEHADRDIAVNCVTPAAARTAIFDQMAPEHVEYMLSKIPRGRFVEVDEIAAMIAWLVSAENSFTTGAAFDLSGGRATY